MDQLGDIFPTAESDATLSVLVNNRPAPPTLEELQSPDQKVSAEAWERAFPLLWDTAIRLLTCRLLVGAEHEHTRQDIAAHALEQVVRGIIEKREGSFNQIAAFDDVIGMTHRILRARTTDFFRHQGRRPELLTDQIPERPSAHDNFQAENSETALTREEMDSLIAKLPPPQPEIFNDHYVLGNTAAEIGEKRKMSRNTVLSHLHRGKKLLRGWLLENNGTRASQGA